MKVILVDDNLKRVESLLGWMSTIGVASENITVVDNTSEARFLISRNYYDVLLLDVVLPKRKKDKAIWSNGIDLLRYISASSRVKKPEKIIGITAHSDDISSFRDKFDEYCLNVIEVKPGTSDWMQKLSKAFAYTQSSKIARLRADGDLVAITVHGIRTFGQWQERLKKIVQDEASYIKFLSYKYGHFPVLFFVFPALQRREVTRLKNAIRQMVLSNKGKEFIIFSHSFGTHVVAHALQELFDEGEVLNIKTLVLSGSVLKATHDWSFIQKIPGIKLINECGSDDRILWLSEAFVPKTGMAGRSGFYGFNSDQFMNRYHKGGHSLYFDGEDFMRDKWLPLFMENPGVPSYESRSELSSAANAVEQLSVICGRFGIYILIFFILLIMMLLLIKI